MVKGMDRVMQLCAGRVPWLCHAVQSCRLSPSRRLRASGPLIDMTYRPLVRVQCFVSYPEAPGANGLKDETGSTEDGQRKTDTTPANFPSMGIRSRRAWGRSLSPLDRVSQMIPSEFVSQEIQDLRGAEEKEALSNHLRSVQTSPPPQEDTSVSDPSLEDEGQVCADQGTPFRPGDLVISDFKRKHYSEFKKMFSLTESGKLLSNWGAISHKEIVGKLPGQKLRTSIGFEFLLKRPSLEEYVLMMKRGPTISYPKDITAMLRMMDVSPGDVILEAGSGSGGMTLFLSRAVGSEGHVYSFEVRADHHAIAKRNFSRWKKAWDIRSSHPWPDNVYFINKDVLHAVPDIKSVAFDAVALDMIHPQVALPAIIQNLKQGAVCAAYVANITQVIDLLEGVRSCQLPLVCEKITEICVKEWLVAPSVRKDGTRSQRVDPQWNSETEIQNQEHTDDDDNESHSGTADVSDGVKPFGQVPYIARPMPWHTGHTAFLVQLRKFKQAPKYTEPKDPC
ncbi:tRNA (adenine(58)-N(1))-methyltransferase, mitochondrial [Rhinophrynus dorsalis]